MKEPSGREIIFTITKRRNSLIGHLLRQSIAYHNRRLNSVEEKEKIWYPRLNYIDGIRKDSKFTTHKAVKRLAANRSVWRAVANQLIISERRERESDRERFNSTYQI